jgi:hypothetical protein
MLFPRVPAKGVCDETPSRDVQKKGSDPFFYSQVKLVAALVSPRL